MTIFDPWGTPEYNKAEVNIGEFYQEQGKQEELKRIIEMLKTATKKPSAAMAKVIERLENDLR